jgi:ribonuclease-3
VSASESVPSVADFSRAVGYTFANPELLQRALAHPSYAYDTDGSRGNERLEFLGDAVLDLAISELQFHAHPDWSEGDLTRSRASLVNKAALADRARELGLDRFILLGRTERRSAGQRKDSVLANCLEAVIGAMYLDSGMPEVRAWVERVFVEAVEGGMHPQRRDAKTRVQEYAHATERMTPHYRTVTDSGKENDEERFTVELIVGEEVWAVGVGRSKRVAEREAAEAAMNDRQVAGDD